MQEHSAPQFYVSTCMCGSVKQTTRRRALTAGRCWASKPAHAVSSGRNPIHSERGMAS